MIWLFIKDESSTPIRTRIVGELFETDVTSR